MTAEAVDMLVSQSHWFGQHEERDYLPTYLPGRQLFEKLRKIHLQHKRRNWFEEMWSALKAHDDTPTPGGLSPHQILFGRDPVGRGLPLSSEGP